MDTIDFVITKIITYLQTYGILFGMFMIILESMIPILPLGVFIAFNMMAYGTLIGFLVSYVATIIGCLIAYSFSKKIYLYMINRQKKQHATLNKLCTKMKQISFSALVLIIALPFSPAFLINIAAGVSNINRKKFFFSLIVGKVSIVYFWGFISKSLLESITDFKTIIAISILLLFSFIVSKIVSKKLKIE